MSTEEDRQEPVETAPLSSIPETVAQATPNEGGVYLPNDVTKALQREVRIFEPDNNDNGEQQATDYFEARGRLAEKRSVGNPTQETTQQLPKTGRSLQQDETRQQRRERLTHGGKIVDTYAKDNGLTGNDKVAYDWIRSTGGFDKYEQLGEGLAIFKSENKSYDFNKNPKLQAEIKERADQILRNYKLKKDFETLDKQISENQRNELARTVSNLQKELNNAKSEIATLQGAVKTLQEQGTNRLSGGQVSGGTEQAQENVTEEELNFEHTDESNKLKYSGKLLYEVRSSGKINGPKQKEELEQVSKWVLGLEDIEESKNLVDKYINPNDLGDKNAIIDLTNEIVLNATLNKIKALDTNTSLSETERDTELETYLNVLTGGMAQPRYIKGVIRGARSKISSTAAQPISQLYP